ncbi:MAG: 2-hydroxyacyl-CoA dehydratase [Candidatus Omnitrophota bacterium]
MAKKILVIDDDPLVTKTLVKYLKSCGYEIESAFSGKEAIKKVEDSLFNLIIADIRMPGMDGLETIKKLRDISQDKYKTKIPEIVITGYASEESKKEAEELGVLAYIYKPFDKDEFLEAIKTSLKIGSQIEFQGVKGIPLADNKTLIDNFIKEQTEQSKRLILNKKFPIMGWCNTYVPEEIIIAAGFLPYRVMGAPISLSLSKTYLSGNLCGSVQSILECALRGDYNFLDGMIIGASTDATKRLYDAWIRYINTQFCHLFDIPKFINDDANTHYMESIHSLIEEFEKHFKIKVSNSDIKEAISICNKTRKFLTELNNLRKMDNPSISSQQFLEVCKLAMVSNKIDFNDSLETLLSQIKPGKEDRQGLRILLTGSFQDQPWLLDIIEEKGGIVVCEDFCTRLRYFTGSVDEDTDLIRAIARRYLKVKPASASLVSIDQRADYLLKLIREFNIDGVIYYILKFDDPYLFEFPDMKETLTSHNIPVLRIETEHNTSAMGQIMTRVQAFIETLKLAKSRKTVALLTQ